MRWVFLTIGLAVALAVAPAYADECPGDVNDDNVVNVSDLLQVLSDWGACPGCASDINGDDFVDIQDLLTLLGDWGCEEPEIEGTPLSGVVTNLWTGDPLVGVTVTVGEDELITNESGEYAGEFPPGIYDITFAKTNYITLEDQIVLFPDFPMTLDVALEPAAPVIVTIEVTGDPEPGAALTATAIVEIFDGSTITGFEWMQTAGTEVEILDANTDTATVNLGQMGDYKATLFEILAEPPIGPDDLPPGVPPPPEEFPGGLQNRFQVTGINPWALEDAALLGLAVEVTTTSGTYDAEDEVHTLLPWKPTTSILNGPIGVPVLLHGKDQDTYNWSLSTPGGSEAMLDDGSNQNPSFVPDVPGLYRATVTELGVGTVTLDVWAGTWRGIIEGQDEDGLPIPEQFCVNCHGPLGIDKFTPWKATGHASIFKDQLNESTHYGPSCFPCHTVGFDTDAVNNGFDDQPDYQAFLDSGLLNNPGDNWSVVVEDFPDLAKLANIQCENCHGPQNGDGDILSPAHTQTAVRVSLSADVCGSCHGEPARHGRFQQWQLSGHANYDVAIDEGQSGNCSRCHTSNGFLTWLPVLTGEVEGDPYGNIEVTWTEDETHPQTCATCHDPHAIGTMSGDDNNATVRISGDTPPLIAGFTAYGVGRGAICMTCHNSRRGLHNDDVFDEIYQTSEAARAPHGSAQTDVIMGQNVYLMDYGIRGGHSFVTDTCAGCHMQVTPPPELLSYNQSGTNHTFYASIEICADCHGEALEGENIQNAAEETLLALQGALEDAIVALMDDQIALGNSIDLDGEALITDISVIADIEFGESHGRQAITVTFTDETVLGPFSMNDVLVLDADMQELGEFYDFADPALVKGGWNWTLVHNDASLGVHNPTFAFTAMTNALTAIDPLVDVPVDWRTLLEEWKQSVKK
jgi:hypothetical protein